MTGSIYLIGGGEIRNGDTSIIDEEIKSLAPIKSTFVFIGFASQDSPGYAQTIKSVYGDKFKVLVPTNKMGREYAVKSIESAAVIYIGGGETNILLQLFSDWDLLKHLKTANKRGAHIVGMSAGAQALSAWYLDEETDELAIKKGWGVVSICTLVHANLKSFSDAKSFLANHAKSIKVPFVAISEGAGLRLDSNFYEHKVGRGQVWKIKKV